MPATASGAYIREGQGYILRGVSVQLIDADPSSRRALAADREGILLSNVVLGNRGVDTTLTAVDSARPGHLGGALAHRVAMVDPSLQTFHFGVEGSSDA